MTGNQQRPPAEELEGAKIAGSDSAIVTATERRRGIGGGRYV